MSASLCSETISIIKSTALVMQQHGVAITTRMYERLFVDPELRELFDEAARKSGEQPKRLAAALLAFASNADSLNVLKASVERIAARHVAMRVKPEHYPAVANALLPAIKDVLGDAAEERILNAWGEAYWFLAEVLKAREDSIHTRGG